MNTVVNTVKKLRKEVRRVSHVFVIFSKTHFNYKKLQSRKKLMEQSKGIKQN